MARFDLNDKVALITGGARGIGLATAHALASRGAKIVIVDLDQEACDRAAAEVSSDAFGIAADVTDRGAMQRAVATTVDRFGGLDVVIANAGIASRAVTMRAMATETFDRVLDVDTYGVVRTVEAALPEIVRRKGHVVVIASVYAFVNGVGTIPYAMSKAAVEQLGRGLRIELARHGASATVGYFGFIDTEMVHQALDADPISDAFMKTAPKVLMKRLPPKVAGEALARGIERRKPRVIRPKRWAVFSVLRGVIGPLLDSQMVKHAETQAVVAQLDDRAGEEQPTTA
jgi:NAD(P)-dependent dehydrogenase (short-subunit alcohol dehydrogenase family)